MTVFEKVAASPEALGELLESLTVIDSPWEEAFHRVFCDSCIDSNGTQNCDTPGCPHEAERNNPLWWLTRAAEGERETAGDSEREFLIREHERRLARLKSGAPPCGLIWRKGRVEIVPLRDEERRADGTCNAFNVYLNGKGPDGILLKNIERVILPKVYASDNGKSGPMAMKLVFGGCEDAAEIIKRLGKKCKLEIRAAVENWNYSGKKEYHGHSYILEAVPLELKLEPLERLGGTGVTIGFLVYRYTATIEGDQLWGLEWGTKGEEAAPCGDTERREGVNPDMLRRSEILSLERLFHVSIGTATEYRDILAAQAKQSGVGPK